MDLILKVRHYFFKKYMATNRPPSPTSRKTTNLESAKSVGILFDATDPKNRQTVADFAAQLARLGKKVRLLGFVNLPEKQVPTDLPFVHFNKKTVNWYGRPVSEKAEVFCKEKFDLLLCLFSGENRPLEWLAARSSARMKAGGVAHFFQNLDLSVETAPGKGLPELIAQLEFYFKRLVVAETRVLATAE